MEDLTTEQLSQYHLQGTEETIPNFLDVLKVFEGKAPLIVEIKVENNVDALCETVAKVLDAYQGDYCVESFDPRAVYWFKKNRPHVIRGQLTENYVLQQLRGQFETVPYYYADKNSELDFLIQYGTEIIPIEAKGGENKTAASFKKYINEKEPAFAIRYSKRGYRRDGYITNIPLYLVGRTKELL